MTGYEIKKIFFNGAKIILRSTLNYLPIQNKDRQLVENYNLAFYFVQN